MLGSVRDDLEFRGTLSPADHQTHRRLSFQVPPQCGELRLRARYAPKTLVGPEAVALVQVAIERQAQELRIGLASAVAAWRELLKQDPQLVVANLLTVSLDDATGKYRGAGHRHDPDQEIWLRPGGASPGFMLGPLPAGSWSLWLTCHTVVTQRCDYVIQIGLVSATSEPSGASARA